MSMRAPTAIRARVAMTLLAASLAFPLHATAQQASPPDNDKKIWDFFGRSVERLNAASNPEEREEVTKTLFQGKSKEEIEQIGRIMRLMQRAGESGAIYINPGMFGTPPGDEGAPYVAAGGYADYLDRRVKGGLMTEEEKMEALRHARDRTNEALDALRQLNGFIDLAAMDAEGEEPEEPEAEVEEVADICRQWNLEISYSTPPSNPGEPPHTFKSQGTWTLQPDTGEIHAMLTDPEMTHWAFAFPAPAGPLETGRDLEFRSIEQYGLFQDSIGAWEGTVIDPGVMTGTFRYNGGGCCGSGPVSGSWEARCIAWLGDGQ